MPTSKGRKPKRPNPNKAVPRKKVAFKAESIHDLPDAERFSRDPAKPFPADELYKAPVELPEPATEDQLLVALFNLDPLTQEVMIAERLAAMPNPGDPEKGQPVHIERVCRGPWAHNLRKLGIFCIPELATHELIAPDRASGTMVNHTAQSSRSRLTREDLWEKAKTQSPEIAKLVDDAKTPEERDKAMEKLLSAMPVHIRLAAKRLARHSDEELRLT